MIPIVTNLNAKASGEAMTVGELRQFLAYVTATAALEVDADQVIPKVRIDFRGRIKSISALTELPGRPDATTAGPG